VQRAAAVAALDSVHPMEKKMKTMFTDQLVDDVTLPEGKRDHWIWDRQQDGLGLRMRRGANGVTKTWYVSYRANGQERRDPLAKFSDLTLNDARHRVYEIRRDAADGIDARERKAERVAEATQRADIPIFADYAEHYLQLKRPELRANTYRERERYLAEGDHFAPFAALRLDRITRAMVAARLNWLQTKGVTKPSAHVAQAARMALLDLFKLAVAEGHLEENPVTGTRQPAPGKKNARDRVLTSDELVMLWKASGDDDYGRIIKLAILLGGRREEIGSMHWSEIDEAGNWTLPAARSKNRKALVLPLPAAALEIFGPRGDGFVFGRAGFSNWSESKRLLDARLGFATPWVLHDLRRTFITRTEDDLDIPPHHIKAVVNHARDGDVTNRFYNRARLDNQKRDALAKWADYIIGLVDGRVVRIAA
jgi:integrase